MEAGEAQKEEVSPSIGAQRAKIENGSMPAEATKETKQQNREPVRRETPKIGRNDKCPCGSGKKYKNCCGKNE